MIEASELKPDEQVKPRSSNIELMRIILMLAIIAHHYVVSSGVSAHINLDNSMMKSAFLLVWGMWGKTAINAFVLITGYFMCTKQLSWKKVLKLWLEIKFYRVVIALILSGGGLYSTTPTSIAYLAFGNLQYVGDSFPASFLALYLFIPGLNIAIKMIGRRGLRSLVILLVAYFCIPATFFSNDYVFSEVFWYCTLYLLAAYVRLHARPWMNSKSKTARFLLLSLLLGIASVLILIALLKWGPLATSADVYETSLTYYWYWVHNSNKMLALLVGLAVFLWFKNIDLGYIPVVNTLASTTLGVLLVHAHSSAMSRLIWTDLLSVSDMFEGPIALLVLQALLVPIIIYLVCSAIDLIRIHVLEKPLMRSIDRNEDRVEKAASCILARVEKMVGRFI